VVKINKQKSCFSWFLSFVMLLLPSFVDGYDEIAVTNGGIITGAVRVQGKVPKLAPLKVTKFKEVCRNVPDQSLVVGPSQGIRYAVVTLEGVTKGKAIEKETIHELDNVNCRFVPHVVVASVGQFVLLKNSDPILHTAHAYFKDQPHFNVGMYPGRVSRKPLAAAGTAKVICEVHPWMSAHLVITDHPYHAVTDVYGEYQIQDVPPGTYRLKIWHEKLGVQERPVEVTTGTISKVDFILPVSGEVKR
jgi:plastocyanin